MTIAFRLHEAMSKAGIPSQSELARRSGVPQPTINRILKGGGRQGPATETLKKLALACGVPFQWLSEGTGEERRAMPGEAVPRAPHADREASSPVSATAHRTK